MVNTISYGRFPGFTGSRLYCANMRHVRNLFSVLSFGLLSLTGCSSPSVTENFDVFSSDPFNLGNSVKTSSSKDLTPLIEHCEYSKEYTEVPLPFKSQCTLTVGEISIPLNGYYLDSTGRVVLLSAMVVNTEKRQEIIEKLGENTASVMQEYTDICIQYGRNTLPQLLISSKDKCDHLLYRLV
jgi:hypothetical protein